MTAPGQEQFDRHAVVQMGSTQIEGLRVQFKIEKNNDEAPNSASITVWNLASTTRGKILLEAQKPGGVPVVLTAGYGSNLSVLFNGDIIPLGLSVVRSGPDWLTTFKAGDGLGSYRSDRLKLSVPKGMDIGSVVQQILGQFKGVKTDDVKAKINGLLTGKPQAFSKGSAFSGGCLQELNRLLKGHGLLCTSQDGKLDVATIGKPTPPVGVVPALSSATGLIGSPEPSKDNFVKFKCLLRPEIRIQRQVQVTAGSPPVVKLITVFRLTHMGDTRGQEWYTDIEGQAQ